MADKSYIDAASQLWNTAKEEYPNLSLVASLAPGTSTATSALELNDAVNRGDKVDMALSAVGLIPGGSLVKKGLKGVKAGEEAAAAALRRIHSFDSQPAYRATQEAADAIRNSGIGKAAAGAIAEATNAAANVRDYLSHRAQQDREYSEAWGLGND